MSFVAWIYQWIGVLILYRTQTADDWIWTFLHVVLHFCVICAIGYSMYSSVHALLWTCILLYINALKSTFTIESSCFRVHMYFIVCIVHTSAYIHFQCTYVLTNTLQSRANSVFIYFRSHMRFITQVISVSAYTLLFIRLLKCTRISVCIHCSVRTNHCTNTSEYIQFNVY